MRRGVLRVLIGLMLILSVGYAWETQVSYVENLSDRELEEVSAGWLDTRNSCDNTKIILWDEAKKTDKGKEVPRLFRLEIKR
jgi:hypothetical protein